MSKSNHETPMHLAFAGNGKVRVVDTETGIVLRTLDSRTQAEGWRAEAGKPSASKR